ncbi:MAG: hypothetical protein L0Z50_26790 [Verrucomicrobiales bacterium]|nr:hypothetical protein [Verrucomicrobiales bacterium]
MQIPSGYHTITPIQIANAVWALSQGLIDAHALRVYFACFELTAIRRAARRYRRKRGEPARELARYRLAELERLTKLDEAEVRRALRQLEDAGLVAFSEGEVAVVTSALVDSEELLEELACSRSPKRPIPVPRALLRFFAQNRLVSLTKTMLAYMLRGLAIAPRTGEINAKGTVKASWIADIFNLSERAVKYAQAWLREQDWITPDTHSHQRKLNRHGAYFEINLDWRFAPPPPRPSPAPEPPQQAPLPPAPGPTLVKPDKPSAAFALLAGEIAPPFAPPKEDRETSYEDKNQETQATEPSVSGFCQNEKGPVAATEPAPTLYSVLAVDLRRLDRLEELHRQAVALRWISSSEANVLNFISAAVRARDVGQKPGALFVSLVRRGLWTHITQAQEEYARLALARCRERRPHAFSLSDATARPSLAA